MKPLPAATIAALFAAIVACAPGAERAPAGERGEPGAGQPAIVLRDVTAAAGLAFRHRNDATPRRYLPETMGAGAAFFDADGDRRPDLYLVAGGSLTGDRPTAGGALFRNLGADAQGQVRFEDVTAAAGLDAPFYGLGTAVGDVDNDGDLDLFVTGLDGDRLYRNDSRDGGVLRFEEIAAAAGLTDRGFGSSAAFVDVDRDGWLDLFVGRYVTWRREDDVRCSPDGEHPSYCTPEVYPGATNRLYRNLGVDGAGRLRFADVTAAAGLLQPEGKTLGVVPLDHDGDGWPDLAVANDTHRNFLFVNNGVGADGGVTFREEAVESGLAFSLSGATRGAMGIDAGDLDGDGREEVVIGNFAQEMSAVYRPSARGVYVDDAARLGLGLPTLMRLAFGTLAVDLDNDSRLDLVFANGHIEPEIARFQALQTYAQPLQVFHNRGAEGFAPIAAAEGPLAAAWVGRGLAAADVDGDGDLDLVLTQNGRSARLLQNDSPPRHWLRIALVGRTSNRTGYGTVVTVVAGQRRIRRTLVSGRSYLSASEPVLTIGLGDIAAVDRLEIEWPSGLTQTVPDPGIDRLLRIEEDTEQR